MGRCEPDHPRRRSVGHGRHAGRHRAVLDGRRGGARRGLGRNLGPRRRRSPWSAPASGTPRGCCRAAASTSPRTRSSITSPIACSSSSGNAGCHGARARKVLLKAVKDAGIPTAIVTMSVRRMALTIADQLDFAGFDVVISGDDVEHAKPHPQPYLLAAERLGVGSRTAWRSRTPRPAPHRPSTAGAAVVGGAVHHPAARERRPTSCGRPSSTARLDDLRALQGRTVSEPAERAVPRRRPRAAHRPEGEAPHHHARAGCRVPHPPRRDQARGDHRPARCQRAGQLQRVRVPRHAAAARRLRDVDAARRRDHLPEGCRADRRPGRHLPRRDRRRGRRRLGRASASGCSGRSATEGRLVSFERRAEFAEVAQGNVGAFLGGVPANWTRRGGRPAGSRCRTVCPPASVDRIVLDMLAPWECLEVCAEALQPGGILVCYIATVTQLSRVAEALRATGAFTEPERHRDPASAVGTSRVSPCVPTTGWSPTPASC